MKERIALSILVTIGWTLVFVAAAQHSWALYGLFVTIGIVYTIIIEGPRFLIAFPYPAVGWLIFASIGMAFSWTAFYRSYKLMDLLSFQRWPQSDL